MAKVSGISNEIIKALAEYTEEVTNGLEQAKYNAANNAVKILKQNSPKDTGSYAKGWRVTKVRTKEVVHNKTDYQLTHLLENGHAKKNGGRVAARVHIRPVEQQAIDQYISDVESVIKK